MVGTIEIVMRKIDPSGSITETVLVSLPSTESQETTHSSDILTFSNLEIRINEQTVYTITIPFRSPTMSSLHYSTWHLIRPGSIQRANLRSGLEREPGACGYRFVGVGE